MRHDQSNMVYTQPECGRGRSTHLSSASNAGPKIPHCTRAHRDTVSTCTIEHRCRDGSNQSNGPLYPIRSNECAIERELALSLLRSVVSKIRTSSTLSKYFMSTDTVPLYDPQESLAISTWQRVKPPHAVAVSSVVSYMYGNEAASTPPHTDEPPPKGTIAIPRGPAYRKRSRMSRSVRGNAT